MTTLQPLPSRGKRLGIFVGESQQWQGKPLYRALVELAQQHGAAGATVLRGIEGLWPRAPPFDGALARYLRQPPDHRGDCGKRRARRSAAASTGRASAARDGYGHAC